ncbi:hypothetical protein [Streptomyces liangshanensis]|uniref:Uncharacterized protein n=1 Tax=Streptomyces liangshanensis TaxID=2717324 RepID=A0A6G9H692_9ACTN|nr:hypothetical protein [Streptomyces liangshanensis]QIQ06062.1 hypothetical protein HA039_30485 [Streptomyces liangshanensis]
MTQPDTVSPPSPSLTLELTLDEANLVLEALGQLPYARVYRFIDRIQEEARTQLAPAGAGHDTRGSLA